jgi:hypothetical protein
MPKKRKPPELVAVPAEAAGALRSRIVGHEDVPPEQLLANPLNFRTHPEEQVDALRGSMRELGWLKGVIVNRTTGHILDGHARVEEARRQGLSAIPVDFVELPVEEERLALAILDPITELAERNEGVLQELLGQVATEDPALQAMLYDMAPKEAAPPDDEAALARERERANTYSEQFGVVVMCKDEAEQQQVYERLRGEGLVCKVVTT